MSDHVGADPWESPPSPPVVERLPPIRNLWAWWAWSMVGVVALLVSLAIARRIVRTSIALDLLAAWPVFGVLVVSAIVGRRREWPPRIVASIPLATLSVILAVVALHAVRSPVLPSSVVVEGPAVTGGSASLRVDAPAARLVMSAASLDVAFEARPLPGGGSVGVPRLRGFDSSPPEFVLVERGDPGLHRSEGWEVLLDGEPRWALDVVVRSANVDLTGVVITGLVFDAEGTVTLDGVAAGATVELVGGPVRVSVPGGIGVAVVGAATVPEGWRNTADGAVSPEGGGGFTIVVGPGVVAEVVRSPE